MALSADKMRSTRNRGIESYSITAGQTIYAGALVCVVSGSGTVSNLADTAGFRFLGIAVQPGSLSAYGITGMPSEVQVNTSGVILERVSVTGASDITSVGSLVYATDNDTLTLTPTTNLKAIGQITRWHSGAVCDVRLFTPAEYMSLL